MLTSMFYFNHYKPYLIKEDHTSVSAGQKPRLSFYAKNASGKKAVLLNKAYKRDIIEYAGNLSREIVAFKDTARYIVQDMDRLGRNARNGDSEQLKHLLSGDIKQFVKSYNSSVSFALSQEHSAKLHDFAIEQKYFIVQGEKKLEKLGISIDENGNLDYNETKISDMSVSKLKNAIDGAALVFDEIYSNIREFLTYPLASHMNFKGLGYYYNYKVGAVQDDTFRIIKSGILVDIAI